MADSGPSRRHGWILRVRVIPGNGLDSFGDPLGTRFLWPPCRSEAQQLSQRWVARRARSEPVRCARSLALRGSAQVRLNKREPRNPVILPQLSSSPPPNIFRHYTLKHPPRRPSRSHFRY